MESPIKMEPPEVPESNRRAGRMSLRPNKKVKLELHSDDDDDIAEGDRDDSADFAPGNNQSDDDLEGVDELDPSILLEKPKIGRKASRRILYAAKTAAKRRREELHLPSMSRAEQLKVIARQPFLANKDLICAGCSAELSPASFSRCVNIFKDLTSTGKSFYDLLTSVVKEELNETMCGTHLCPKCKVALNDIEYLYGEFRKAADTFRDNFVVGQKAIDADLAGVEDIGDLNSMIGALNLNLDSVTIKVLHNQLDSFNALMLGSSDFGCATIASYCGSIVTDGNLPPDEMDESNMDGISSQVITIMMDGTKTTIPLQQLDYNSCLVPPEIANKQTTGVVIYMVESEFQALKKSQRDRIIYITIEEFARLNSTVMLGAKATWLQIVCSSTVANEYKRQVLSATRQFVCADCGASFDHFNMLTNHIQSSHVDVRVHVDFVKRVRETAENFDSVEVRAPDAEENADADDGGLPNNYQVRSGEKPTLEKPYQCEHCDKCFISYANCSSHVDHYHGFSRKCNVAGCEEVPKSIQEFVQHNVSHVDNTVKVPEHFKEKFNVLLPCPSCPKKFTGVWKFYHHTFQHDAVPRFKCPECDKRFKQVQNFESHVLKHRIPHSSRSKLCKFCEEVIDINEFNQHQLDKHWSSLRYVCDVCKKPFQYKKNLDFHKEMHIPKDMWAFKCDFCSMNFPSEQRLTAHEKLSHKHEALQLACSYCPTNKVYESREDLAKHINQTHSRFRCSRCEKRFSELDEAWAHFRGTHTDRPVRCIICEEDFAMEDAFLAHLAQDHERTLGSVSPDNERFICRCGKTFITAYERIQHVRTVHLTRSVKIDKNRENYEEAVEKVGDHIIEFVKTGYVIQDTIRQIHSIP